MREAVEDELVLEPELARFVRDAEYDDGACADAVQDQRVHAADVAVVIVRRDRHAPGAFPADALVLIRAIVRMRLLDPLHDGVHLACAMRKSNLIRQAATPDLFWHDRGSDRV